jgi:hypothetical protein
VQLEGITKTDGFGLIYDRKGYDVGIISAMTNVTPESREFLQNVLDCSGTASTGAFFPATTQSLLKVNPAS